MVVLSSAPSRPKVSPQRGQEIPQSMVEEVAAAGSLLQIHKCVLSIRERAVYFGQMRINPPPSRERAGTVRHRHRGNRVQGGICARNNKQRGTIESLYDERKLRIPNRVFQPAGIGMAAKVSTAGGMVLSHVRRGFDIPIDLHSQGAESRITLAPKLSIHAPQHKRAANGATDTRSDELRDESHRALVPLHFRNGKDIWALFSMEPSYTVLPVSPRPRASSPRLRWHSVDRRSHSYGQ
jgi:hypothetical protein